MHSVECLASSSISYQLMDHVMTCMETVYTADNIFYFVVMIRHGAHVIFTQMVSTHEAMTRGSLDFPNLISLNDVTQNFVVNVEIYGMVSKLFVLMTSVV